MHTPLSPTRPTSIISGQHVRFLCWGFCLADAGSGGSSILQAILVAHVYEGYEKQQRTTIAM